MKIEYSPSANALYLTLRDGDVVDTVELDDMVYADVAEDGQPLGIEFVNADDFLPFLRRHAGPLTLPDDLVAMTAALVEA